MANIQQTAIGDCGISPDEFRRMTPREVQWRIDAFFHQGNRQMELLAQVACWVTAPHVKKPLRVRDLIRRQSSKKTDWEKWAKD